MKFLFLFFIIFSLAFGKIELTCPKSYHSCGSTSLPQCIPNEWICDHNPDCNDGSDEENCKKTTCKSDEFQCPNSDVCLILSKKCDGNKDCIYGSDEENCTFTCDKLKEYDCLNTKKLECIPLNEVCSHKINCTTNRNLKENCQKDLCQNNKKCSHICINKFSSFECSCPLGMKLREDNFTCLKINTCLENPEKCEQECHYEAGDFVCSCFEGYKKVGSNCKLNDGRAVPYLLYSVPEGLFSIPLFDRVSGDIQRGTKLMEIENQLGFDSKVDEAHLEIYSTFVKNETVLSLNILNNWNVGTNNFISNKINDKTFSWNTSFFSMAADPVRNLVYWTDTKSSKISVFNSSNLDKTDVVTKDCYYPIFIVLNSKSSKIAWIDLGNDIVKPRIMIADMDGSNQRVLINSGLRKPRSLVWDTDTNILYWSDLFPGAIKYIDLKHMTEDKIKIEVLFENFTFLPCSLALYKNRIYWSDCYQNRIYSIHKVSGKGLITVMRVYTKTIRIVSPEMTSNIRTSVNDPKSGSFCSGVRNSCEYSCLPTSSYNIVKCFGSNHQKILHKSQIWWLVLIPIAVLAVVVLAIFKYRNTKTRSLPHSAPVSNVYVYDHVRFWDDDNNNKKGVVDDAEVIDVPDSSPIIEAV